MKYIPKTLAVILSKYKDRSFGYELRRIRDLEKQFSQTELANKCAEIDNVLIHRWEKTKQLPT